MFIVVEGIDYSGKSSLIQALSKIIKEREEVEVKSFRNPGGTELGEKIRDLFKSDIERTRDVDYALLLASRLSILHEVTKLVSKEVTVIVDRWDASAHVNQVEKDVQMLKSNIVYNCLPAHEDSLGLEIPDVCILLDPSYEVAKHRKKLRDGVAKSDETDRYGMTSIEDFSAWYKKQSETFRNVCSVIPGGANWEIIEKRLRKHHKENEVVLYQGIDHPVSRKMTYGTLLYVPITDINETPEQLAERVYQGFKLTPIVGAHQKEAPKEMMDDFKQLVNELSALPTPTQIKKDPEKDPIVILDEEHNPSIVNV